MLYRMSSPCFFDGHLLFTVIPSNQNFGLSQSNNIIIFLMSFSTMFVGPCCPNQVETVTSANSQGCIVHGALASCCTPPGSRTANGSTSRSHQLRWGYQCLHEGSDAQHLNCHGTKELFLYMNNSSFPVFRSAWRLRSQKPNTRDERGGEVQSAGFDHTCS